MGKLRHALSRRPGLQGGRPQGPDCIPFLPGLQPPQLVQLWHGRLGGTHAAVTVGLLGDKEQKRGVCCGPDARSHPPPGSFRRLQTTPAPPQAQHPQPRLDLSHCCSLPEPTLRGGAEGQVPHGVPRLQRGGGRSAQSSLRTDTLHTQGEGKLTSCLRVATPTQARRRGKGAPPETTQQGLWEERSCQDSWAPASDCPPALGQRQKWGRALAGRHLVGRWLGGQQRPRARGRSAGREGTDRQAGMLVMPCCLWGGDPVPTQQNRMAAFLGNEVSFTQHPA